MDRRLPISPIPNNLRKNLDSLKEPYSEEGYQGTKATDKDRTKDRTYHTRRDDDTVGNIKVDLKDNDSVIPYYFDNVIKPTVVKDGTLIDVPLIYGGAEIWKTVQRDGYYRDKESKIQVPLIMFKRNTVTKRRDIGNKLDGNQAHLFQTFEKKYNSRNQYDNFDILNNRSPEKEYHAVVVPDYVTLTYDCIIWTEYVENMNKLVESINFASDSYWGDPNRWKFKATIDSFQNQTEVTVGGNRIVRTTFTLTLNGYLIPDVYNKALANKTKFSSVTNIKFTDEQFILQNAQTQPQPTVSTFTTTGPGALSGGGTTISAFPFTGDAVIDGSLTVSGSFVNFKGATAISGSVFSGSFVGNGSGLTGIISSSYATTSSYAFYAVSASHEIIKEVSSSYADTASFAQSGNGTFSGSFSGSYEGNGSGLTNIPASGITGLNLSQIASGSATASISPNNGFKVNTNTQITGSLNISGSIDITLPEGSAFTIHEPDIDQQNRLDFRFNQGDPMLEISSRSTTSSLYLRSNDTDNGLILDSLGKIKFVSSGTNYGVAFTTSGFNPNAPNQLNLGAYNRRWKDIYVNNGDKISFGVSDNSDIDLVSLRHTTGTNELVISGSSDITLDVKGDLNVSTNITSSGNITSANNISASNNLFTKQLYVENNLAIDYDLTHDCISIGNASDCLNLLGTSITASSNLSSSATSTASFGTYLGDGSQLTGIETDPFPYTGDAVISGSLTVQSGSSNSITGITLINPSSPGTTQDTGAGITMFNYTGVTGSIHIKDYTAGGLNPYHPAMIFNSSDAFYFKAADDARDGTWFTAQKVYQNFHMDQINNNAAEWIMGINNGGSSYSRLVIGQGSTTANGWFFQNNGYDEDLKIGETTGAGGTGTYTNRILISSSRMQIGDSSNDLKLSVSGSITSNNTASAAYFVGDGSQLTNLPSSDPFPYSGSAIISSSGATASLTLEGSGSTVFDIIGSQGTLFSVDDDLSGTIFTANDISGLPILEASASGDVYIGKSPQSLYTTAVISSTTAATTQSIFGLSTSSYDGAFFDYTVQSGSNARAGSIMSIWSGSTINYTETTTTDIGNTTDFNLIVHISQSQAQIASHATNAGYKIKTIIRSI